jgi:hypothetical protein
LISIQNHPSNFGEFPLFLGFSLCLSLYCGYPTVDHCEALARQQTPSFHQPQPGKKLPLSINWVDLLTVLVQSVIRRLTNSLSHVEESMAGHVSINGIY